MFLEIIGLRECRPPTCKSRKAPSRSRRSVESWLASARPSPALKPRGMGGKPSRAAPETIFALDQRRKVPAPVCRSWSGKTSSGVDGLHRSLRRLPELLCARGGPGAGGLGQPPAPPHLRRELVQADPLEPSAAPPWPDRYRGTIAGLGNLWRQERADRDQRASRTRSG
jgi:hypothetical protein